MGLFDLFKKKSDDYGMSMVEKEVREKSLQTNNFTSSSECLMVVEDVFSIMGKGTVVVGKIEIGFISLYENVMIENTGKIAQVTGIEMFRKQLDTAQAGDRVGLLLDGISRDDIMIGSRLIKK